MELKKTKEADLDGRRLTGFLLGLVVALALLFVALEYSDGGDETGVTAEMIEDIAKDLELMPAEQQKNMVAVAPVPVIDKPATKMNIVNEAVEPETHDLSATDAPLQTEGEVTDAASDDDKLTAQQQPVAVDRDDNPLNFRVVERLPEYPGGIVAFMKWLTKSLHYPPVAQRQKIQGKVVVSFIINTDGTISDAKVTKSVNKYLDAEALRVVKLMPRWKPGEDKGKPCRTYFCIPVVFQL